MTTKWIGSPNFTSGRAGHQVQHIVVHHMAGTLASTDSVFQDTQRNTSAHYGVGQSEVHQYVSEANTAYHAGAWTENLQSIGIEHEDFGTDNFTDALYANSAALIRQICERYSLPISRDTIHPHKEFTATACPGALDIDRLIREAKGDEMPALDLARARVLSWGVLGRNGYDGKPNALNGDADADLNQNHVGKDPYAEIWDYFNSPEGKDWIEKRLPAVYKKTTDQAAALKDQANTIAALKASVVVLQQELDAKGVDSTTPSDQASTGALKTFIQWVVNVVKGGK